MMLQLNPPIPFWHPASEQACHAVMALDYSQEHDLMFTVVMAETGEIWVCRASELRGQENITLGRRKQALGENKQAQPAARSKLSGPRLAVDAG